MTAELHRSGEIRGEALWTGFDEGEKCQAAVIRCLETEQVLGPNAVERIDTHISHVFLTGAFAFKLKRAVKLHFLDYSTLESRRLACERELFVNRTAAPEIYLKVVALTRHEDGLELDGSGEVVDYLVMMNRFDERTVFSNLSARKELKEPLVADLAEQIGRIHLGAERTPAFGGAASVERTLQGVVGALAKFETSLFGQGAVSRWALKMDAELLRQHRRLDTRRRVGFVRRCHGDLHLGNVCLVNGRPTPFDAIEFGDDFSSIDVLYDLAFPVMDLVHSESCDLANVLLNRYLELTTDYSGLHLLPLFLSLRAGVRAMVHALSAEVSQTAKSVREAEALSRSYFNLAETFLDFSPCQVVAVGGVSGTGKSTLAKGLATSIRPREGAVILRSDAVRKHLWHQATLIPLPEQAYAEKVNQRVFRALCRNAHRALQAGHSVIIDATCLDVGRRNALEAFATKRNIEFHGLWLEADEAILLSRVRHRASDVSDANAAVIRKQLRRGDGGVTWTRLDAGKSRAETLSEALDVIGNGQH